MIDFTNRKNRFLNLIDVPKTYIENIKEKTKSDAYYPTYHVAPHHGLLNDPNGLSFYKGEHHIFYQWFPLGPVHGLKHWYHVSTKDFVHYCDHGIAMYPDQTYDSYGCYSGSSLEVEGELFLFYTGNRKSEKGGFNQSQCLAKMDSSNLVKKIGVIVDRDETVFTENFRDPVVFQRTNHSFLLVGGETIDNQGALALYKGETFYDLSYQGNIDIGINDFGHMWECPNYYEQGKNGVLILSPQGISSFSKYDLKNVFSVVYFVGEKIDVENNMFKNDGFIELDKGFDFYAPQTYEDEKGRRILIGWLGNSKSEYPTDKNGWAHMLTIPRELKIKDNVLFQEPVIELKDLRASSHNFEREIRLISGSFELECEIQDEFGITLQNDEGANITFSSNGEEYCLDRSNMSELYAERFGTERYAIRKIKEKHNVKIFVDQSSMEIFCDNGETVFTTRFFIKDLSHLTAYGVKGKLHYLSSLQVTSTR
ncbi:sucrose-6-phosphate hydrolase [Alkalibacterium sp. f15]|uniref:sucrose-6-phosphate hydrolase n=1 Tax=Alkalibacterium sp. f15 TaxID=3414029 RepID=UPI003BF9270E